MEAGHRGQTGHPVMYVVAAECRNVLALAQIQLLSMGGPSVRVCQYRRAPATHCAQVSILFVHMLKNLLKSFSTLNHLPGSSKRFN